MKYQTQVHELREARRSLALLYFANREKLSPSAPPVAAGMRGWYEGKISGYRTAHAVLVIHCRRCLERGNHEKS